MPQGEENGQSASLAGQGAELAVSRQCQLAGVTRSWVYTAPAGEALDGPDLKLLELIDAEYTRRPFYGSRRMVVYFGKQGYAVNRKQAERPAHLTIETRLIMQDYA